MSNDVPVMVVIGGSPGVGKTTLARQLAGRLRAAHVRVDSYEAALISTGLVGRPADVGADGYALALAAAESCLRAGTDVVVDAVFPVAESREPFTELARRHRVGLRWVRLVCSDRAEHRRRVEQRTPDLTGHTVPTWQAVDTALADEWTQPHVVVDTADGRACDQVAAAVGAPEAVVRAHVAAFDAGDVTAVLAGFAEDATWRTGRSNATGAHELRELFAGAISGLSPRLTVRRLVACGETVAAELIETLTVDGVQTAVPMSGWYRVRDGRIVAATVYREGSAETGGAGDGTTGTHTA